MRRPRPPISAVLCLAFAATVTAQAPDPAAARIDSALRALKQMGSAAWCASTRPARPSSNEATASRIARAKTVQPNHGRPDRIEHEGLHVVALLQLHERGRIDIHDSLAKYFPNAPADKRNITLWQLVMHTSRISYRTRRRLRATVAPAFLDAASWPGRSTFTPGAREQYSNTGYAILAAVIEKVSGTTYDEYRARQHSQATGPQGHRVSVPRL